ncbi:uroporphyrinogen-III C-methyltransferase [Peptococcaceae bacterium CEB3]|nr:uroporphyrinogen-III C-methyltransferase [Peptococcaceae bacterium CEB3]
MGAGPGDPGLITVKGADCLARAEVLVYDRLASRRFLSWVSPECELIYVGKSPERHTLTQGEINALLVRKGAEGKTVVRLKGGDPFVFGRGGEEAEALIEAGLPFEIVPGITSAVAVPAYAGIPVTHRDLTSSLTIVTGHEDPNKNTSSLNWEQIAPGTGTLVFLMGMENLELIAKKLREYGRPAETPVAVIQWGTRPEQRVVTGRLDEISALAEEGGFTSPAIILVGDVVSLRTRLQWFEKKPLFGQRIVVTRARRQASALARAIEEFGGEAWEFPAIDFAPPTDPSRLALAVEKIKSFEWLVFTSVNGVEAFLGELKRQAKDIRDLAGIDLVAIGPATQAALEDRGLRVSFVPPEYRAEAIISGLAGRVLRGQRVLLARAEEARDILPESLKALGADVWDVPAYRTVLGPADRDMLKGLLAQKSVQAVTFTSSSTVRNFMRMVDGDKSLLAGIKLFSIGPITSATARDLGLTIDGEAEKYTIKGLVQALVKGVKE